MSCKLAESDYTFDNDLYNNLEQAVNKKKEPVTKTELKAKLVDSLSKIIDDAVENGDVESIAKLLEGLKQSN